MESDRSAPSTATQSDGEKRGETANFQFRRIGAVSAAPLGLQGALVSLRVNSEPRDDIFVFLDPQGRVYLPVAELKGLGAITLEGVTYQHDGSEVVNLASLKGAKVRFDMAKLAVELTLDANAFPTQRASGRAADTAPLLTETIPNVFLNYGVNSFLASGASPGLNVSLDAGVATGPWVLRNTGEIQLQGGKSRRFKRFGTTLSRDFPNRMQRLEIGDVLGTGSAFTGTLQLGGVSFRRAYETNPGYSRFPSPTADGVTILPAEATVYSSGIPIYRQQLAPGPFRIDNLENLAGQRDMEVVVRQIDGKEQRFQYKFYFSDLALKAGEHEYSYALGKTRIFDTIERPTYGKPAGLFFHRYGLSDDFTLGASGENSDRRSIASSNVTARLDQLGTISVALARSSATDGSAPTGLAWLLAYNFVRGPFNIGVNHRLLSEKFTPLQAILGPDRILKSTRLASGLGIGAIGTLNAYADRSCTASGRCDNTASVGWNSTLARFDEGAVRLTLRVERSTFIGRSWSMAVSYQPRSGPSYAAIAEQVASTRTQAFEISAPSPLSEGAGLSLRLDRTLAGDRVTTGARGEGVWKFQDVAVGFRAAQQRTAGSTTQQSTISLSGGIAIYDGQVRLTRTNADANAVVEIDPPLSGIRVYRNGTLSGVTDSNGRLSLTNVGSYVETEVSINASDLSLIYTLSTLRKKIRATPRGVSVVAFKLSRYLAATGTLLKRSGKQAGVFENVRFEIGALGSVIASGPVYEGEFYIEGLSPGTFPARIIGAKSSCMFSITIPDTDEPVVDLKEIVACEL